ncbi:MAG: thioesterase family protein [Pseudomonadota bacterium]|nr:thioesterase family protein [Pseudomonadota bacterium]
MNRSHFKYNTTFKARWEDIDQYGHVNNIKFYSYVDSAINEFQTGVGQWDPKNSGMRFYAVTNECHFYQSIKFAETLTVGLGIEKLGNSSAIFTSAIFVGESEEPAAKCRSVMVAVDAQSERPMALPEATRKAYQDYILD